MTKEQMNVHHQSCTNSESRSIHSPPYPELSSHIFALYVKNINSNFNPSYSPRQWGGLLLLGALYKSWQEMTPSTGLHSYNSGFNLLAPLSPIHVYDNWDVQFLSALSSPIRYDVIRDYSPRWRVLILRLFAFVDDLTCAPNLNTLKFTPRTTLSEAFVLTEMLSLKHCEATSFFFGPIHPVGES